MKIISIKKRSTQWLLVIAICVKNHLITSATFVITALLVAVANSSMSLLIKTLADLQMVIRLPGL